MRKDIWDLKENFPLHITVGPKVAKSLTYTVTICPRSVSIQRFHLLKHPSQYHCLYLLIEHQHHIAARSLDLSSSCAIDSCRSASPSRTLTPGWEGNSRNIHNTRHLMITGWFLMSICWRYCAHKHRFPPRSVVVCFLCVWCGGGGMQEQELLSTRPDIKGRGT